MRTVPRNKRPQISFYRVRVPKWAEAAEALDLDPEQLTRLQSKVDAAAAAFQAQQIAQIKARTMTQVFHFALEAMNTEGAAILKQIRARSVTLGSKAYELGLIAAPEKGSPIAAPGTPHSFSTQLTQLGTLILKWKCDHPRGSRGTVYHVSRQLDGHHSSADGGFEFLGIAGRKRFEDARLPPGVKRALYEVRAFRSTSSGMTATHIVNFGFSSHGLPVPGKMQLAA